MINWFSMNLVTIQWIVSLSPLQLNGTKSVSAWKLVSTLEFITYIRINWMYTGRRERERRAPMTSNYSDAMQSMRLKNFSNVWRERKSAMCLFIHLKQLKPFVSSNVSWYENKYVQAVRIWHDKRFILLDRTPFDAGADRKWHKVYTVMII